MASLSLPLRPASSEPFRFLDIPGEIRNKVYEIILCVPEFSLPRRAEPGLHDVPTEVTRLRCIIETQLLRTCRTINREADYIMRKKNLFTIITFTIPRAEVLPFLISKRLPILELSPERARGFKPFIMSHYITARTPLQHLQSPWTFVILHRDLERFCGAIMNSQWHIDGYDENAEHIITLVDPTPSSETFFTRKLQEKFLAPYRSTLRGFPLLTFKGAVPNDLKATAEKEIRRSPSADPQFVLRELEDMKAKGNTCFRSGDTEGASESWAGALMKMHRLMGGVTGRKLSEVGGPDFVNRMTALFFDLNSNRAQNYLKPMRTHAGNQELVRGLAEGLFHAVYEALEAIEKYPGSTWQPTRQQIGKLSYREAVGCRLVGVKQPFLPQAESAIKAALDAMPGDAEILKEQDRIAQWRSRMG